MFCKHKWIILSEVKTESIMDQIEKSNIKSMSGLSTDVFDRKLIQILTCTKCGKLTRFTMDI